MSACATHSSAPSVAAVPGAVQTEVRAPLAVEQIRLADLFRGTPVAFTMQQDGSLRATVPRQFSFDAGAIKVKPPLAAVLAAACAVAAVIVGAPADPDMRSPSLARERALSVRDYLAGRGIASTRLQVSGAAQTERVEIVVSDTR